METAASPALQATRSPIHPPNHAQRLRRDLTRRRRRLRQKISLQQINAQFNNLAQLGFGFDALNETYVNMIDAGILDPAKVTRSALQNATSVASTLLTTESVVASIKEDTPAMPAGGAGGMGMM